MDRLAFHLPLNSTSLGQVSLCILRELFLRGEKINLFPIGNADLSSQSEDPEFFNWIQSAVRSSVKTHNRRDPVFKLWHLGGSLESFSDKQILLSFYEVDSPTESELNIIKNNSLVLFSSNYTVSLFKNYGIDNVKYLPLGFDSIHFKQTHKMKRNGLHFGLFGKLEPQRKRHIKVLKNWVQKYGNKQGYFLNCAIFNPFLDVNTQSQILNQALNNQKYWNINFLPYIQSNNGYNEILNNTDIVLAMSGGEGWGLPEFQSVALGKHCVGLNAHAYKDWMTEDNAVLVSPNGKIPAYDNLFFIQGADFNQGNIFDWDDQDFLNALDIAEQKYNLNSTNTAGLDLQNKFTYTKMVDEIVNLIKTI